MEESNTWRHPVDLVAILEAAFDQLPAAAEEGKGLDPGSWDGRAALIPVLLGEDARAIAGALLDALREGAGFDEIAGAVAYAAALRIAHFPTSNEFGDWDTALHTFTFANAVHQGLRRAPSIELLRGAFDAAAGVYLDRFLNVPQVPLPQAQEELEASGAIDDEIAGELLDDLGALLDRQQRVNEAGRLVARHLYGHGDPDRLLATLGRLLLREDRNFHTIQAVEAAARQFALMRATPPAGVIDGEMAIAPGAVNVLVAAARYLAAHSPTVRAQGQTFRIAQRLHRGERLFEEDPS